MLSMFKLLTNSLFKLRFNLSAREEMFPSESNKILINSLFDAYKLLS